MKDILFHLSGFTILCVDAISAYLGLHPYFAERKYYKEGTKCSSSALPWLIEMSGVVPHGSYIPL